LLLLLVVLGLLIVRLLILWAVRASSWSVTKWSLIAVLAETILSLRNLSVRRIVWQACSRAIVRVERRIATRVAHSEHTIAAHGERIEGSKSRDSLWAVRLLLSGTLLILGRVWLVLRRVLLRGVVDRLLILGRVQLLRGVVDRLLILGRVLLLRGVVDRLLILGRVWLVLRRELLLRRQSAAEANLASTSKGDLC